MIKARIAFADLAREMQWDGLAVRLGASHLTPYAHRALETVLLCTDGHWLLVVRERLTHDAQQAQMPAAQLLDATRFAQLYQQALLWPLDYLMIEVAQAGSRIRLRAGMLGTAPVYYRVTDEDIEISYDQADFFDRPTLIDLEMASRRLGLHADYSARQLCSGVLALTERASVYAQPGRTRYHYPAVYEGAAALDRSSPDGVLEAFEQALRQATSARPASAPGIAVELSGGMDSAAVACALSRCYGGVASFGILLDDASADAQAMRRRTVVERLGLQDQALEIRQFPPSLDLQPAPARRDYPLPEFYLEAFEALWDGAAQRGAEWLFTGLGGDQLFPIYADERATDGPGSDAIVSQAKIRAQRLMTPRALQASRSLHGMDAPQGPLPASILASNMCQAPHLLRRGLWPVSPLSAPNLALFCQRLSLADRRERSLMRRYLQAVLGGGVFASGYAKETFAQVLPGLIPLHAPRLVKQLKECALADLGLVSRDAVLELLDDYLATRARALTAPLASFLWLERFVRQFT